LTLLAEHRVDDAPAYATHFTSDLGNGGPPSSFETLNPANSSETTSIYAELRAPLFGDTEPAPFLRGLEVQMAARRDEQRTLFNRYHLDGSIEPDQATYTGVAYTVGAKVSPAPWVMLRGSYATGEQPPAINDLIETDPQPSAIFDDPKRPGDVPTIFLLREGGNRDLAPVQANTLFLGAVVTPFSADGPRFAIDYSQIRRRGDVMRNLFAEDILAHEDYWPTRVTRGPLTDADVASGFTAGPVLAIDARTMNGGALEVDAIDLHANWPLNFLGGMLRIYADASYQMRNTQTELFRPATERAGHFGGPLQWRANGGFEWSTSDLTLGANLQYFDGYSLLTPGLFEQSGEQMAHVQGATRIPSQTYLDLYASWHLPILSFGPLRDARLDFGIVNVLDEAPPRETAYYPIIGTAGYSRYGDPRQRRFELVMSSHF
jgi:outer membrane receptor protein involved in Fe transport